jgi:HAD superfamily hydrolase (TIGR01484 family)
MIHVPMPTRLLAIDLDGTLLTRDGVSKGDREAIERARDAGIEIVVATGRAWSESLEALRAIDATGVMIAAGGAILHDAKTGQTLERSVVHPEVIESVTQSLRRHGHVVHLLQDAPRAGCDYWMIGRDPVSEATRWWFERHGVKARWVETMDQVDSLENTVRVGTTALGSELANIVDEIREDLGDRVVLQSWSAVVESEISGGSVHLLEAFDPTVDKWTMLSSLARRRGIPIDAVAAIGDGLNDVGMIRGAGVGIAMAGSDERVVAVSNRRTGPLGSGVGDAINRLLDEE